MAVMTGGESFNCTILIVFKRELGCGKRIRQNSRVSDNSSDSGGRIHNIQRVQMLCVKDTVIKLLIDFD